MYLAASDRNIADSYYLPLDLLLLKPVRSYSIDLEAFLDLRNSLGFHALLLTFLLGDKVAQLRTSCSYMTTSQGKRDGQEKKCFSPWASLLQEVECFPELLRGLPFILDQKWPTCSSLHRSLSDANRFP